MMALMLVVCFLSILPLSSARLPSVWCAYIAELCCKFETSTTAAVTNYAASTTFEVQDPILHLLPPLLIWAPLEQFKDLFPHGLICPKCAEGNNTLVGTGWRDGTGSARSEPRKIHGVDGLVLLVGRVYKCSRGHEVLSYHPRILEQIPVQSLIPFQLWHKTGFTCEVMDSIFSLVTVGVSLSAIQDMLRKKTALHYHQRKSVFLDLQKWFLQDGRSRVFTSCTFGTFPSWKEWTESLPSLVPSRHAVAGSFLASFWRKHNVYVQQMQETTISDSDAWLSCDHTFASTGNIGLSRDFDSRWITQYGALFCVLNHLGQVVTWRLTPTLTFANITEQMVALKRRITAQGKRLKEFYIDNCCTWRKKLQQVFGPDLVVYLDIFHAVKRVGEKIPKRHTLRNQCMHDLRMVFRDPTDQGQTRLKTTPQPSILVKNLESFVEKWKGVAYDGKKVLSEAAIKETVNIKVHMIQGCLSGIKPGRGTNRNEALHRKLNNIMCSSRYGVELAYALLSTSFFNHNEKQAAKAEKRAERVIEEYDTEIHNPGLSEVFGLAFDNPTTEVTSSKEGNKQASLDINESTYSEFVKRIVATEIQPVQRYRCNAIEDESDEVEIPSPEVEPWENDVHQEVLHTLSLTSAKQILLKAISWNLTYRTISACSETAILKLQDLPFMHMVTSCISPVTEDEMVDEHSKHVQRLENVLHSWNFERVPMEADGNCLFYATAFTILERIQHGDLILQQVLLDLGVLPTAMNVKDLSSVLRKVVVSELLGQNSSYYQAFVPKEKLEEEAKKFENSGHYSGDVGDLVLAALVNVMEVPITVFTSAESMPMLVIMPTTTLARNTTPIYLSYLQYGPGHYDAVVWCEKYLPDPVPEIPSAEVASKCACGRKKSKGVACAMVLNQYATKCPCFKAGAPCTTSCRCKGCQNPHGCRPVMEVRPSIGKKRSRVIHENQKYQLKGRKTACFMTSIGEEVIVGTISQQEFLVISSIIQHLHEDTDWVDVLELDPAQILEEYLTVRSVAQALDLSLALFHRTVGDIHKAIKYYRLQCETFVKLSY